MYHFKAGDVKGLEFEFENETWKEIPGVSSEDFYEYSGVVNTADSVYILGGMSDFTSNRVLKYSEENYSLITPML